LGAALQADGEYEVGVYGLKHQKEKRSMDHFAGLDVSVKDTSVCIVDDTGKIVPGSEGSERTYRAVGGAAEPRLPCAAHLKLLD